MNVQVRFFAAARQAVQRERVDLDVPDGTTVAELRDLLQREFPEMSTLLRHAAFAVDAEYSANSEKIPPNAEIACIPPVSGG